MNNPPVPFIVDHPVTAAFTFDDAFLYGPGGRSANINRQSSAEKFADMIYTAIEQIVDGDCRIYIFHLETADGLGRAMIVPNVADSYPVDRFPFLCQIETAIKSAAVEIQGRYEWIVPER
jgi:hypothetical protein